ncbi:MAG: GT4 family glycosyltransferase PelF [Lachnospiraceae bacterium]|jgi:glycosyltransferase involved in cell wall biosynthesis|nr:GT4 family glycosyltransferase PelF [Lachnospiraceae bacterium]
MRVCLVAEGCYPYAVGGVSSWAHNLIKIFPDVEFILMTIVASRDMRGKFVYELPSNVTEVHELYLSDFDWYGGGKKKNRRARMKPDEYKALTGLLLNEDVNWEDLFWMFWRKPISIDDLLMGEDFLNAVKECYKTQYSQVAFSDFLWTMRSIYLPLFLTMKMRVPKADLYHAVATGYAGVLVGMAKVIHNAKVLISEHGIYTREREEELIKAKWVNGIYKNIWIDQFRKMSTLAYNKADLVTSLYDHARELQIELGCPANKTMITPNGIDPARFANLPGKPPEEEHMVNIGAVLRVTPIKDVKTMIQAFAFAKQKQNRLKLWIMGPWEEDQEYAQECFDLVEIMKIPDVMFTGRINVADYLGRMDVTILTSISEGQPLTILESYAAHKPVIATDVGNCRGLIYGESDDFGEAGILTHIMNVEEIALAMVQMAENGAQRLSMGENGYKRLMAKYQIEHMRKLYRKIYHDFEVGMDTFGMSSVVFVDDDFRNEYAEYDADYDLSDTSDFLITGDSDRVNLENLVYVSPGNETKEFDFEPTIGKKETETEMVSEDYERLDRGDTRLTYSRDLSFDVKNEDDYDLDFMDYEEPTNLQWMIGVPTPTQAERKETRKQKRKENRKENRKEKRKEKEE